MSEYVYPLDGPEYTAAQAGAWHGTRTSGVWAGDDNLAVSVGTGWQLILSPGLAWFTTDQFWGKVYVNTASVAFTLPDVDEALDRICRLVLRWNKTLNAATATLLIGDLSSEPTAPPRQATNEVYDLVLADYLVQHGDTEASAVRLTDQRLNEELCGLMRDGVTRIPSQTLYEQYEAFIATLQSRFDEVDSDIADFESDMLTSFNEWFAGLQYILDGDVAGHLQNEIDAQGFTTYAHSKRGTVHSLTLINGGDNIKFVATARFDKGDTFSINGVAATPMLPNGKVPGNKFFMPGATVMGFLSGTTFFLVGGGGGGSGEQYLVSLPVASWYQQDADAQDEFWYACDITPADWDSSEQDAQVMAADADTYKWISENGFYELAVSATGFSIQAKAIPDFALNVFYVIKTRGED